MAQNSWGSGLIEAIGRAVDARRKELEISAQQVADRTAELGHPLSRSMIAGISNPARNTRLTVPDWLVLAAALEMPPLALLFPGAPGRRTSPLPIWEGPAAAAIDWAAGNSFFGPTWPGAGYATTAAEVEAYTMAALALVDEEAERAELEADPDADGRELGNADRRVQRAKDAVEMARIRGERAAKALKIDWDTPEDVRDYAGACMPDRHPEDVAAWERDDGPADG